jgi:PleD family two-component response regulator
LIICTHRWNQCDYRPSNEGFLVILETENELACVSIVVFHELLQEVSQLEIVSQPARTEFTISE